MLNIEKHYKSMFAESFVMSLGFSIAGVTTFIFYLSIKKVFEYSSQSFIRLLLKKTKKYVSIETQTDNCIEILDLETDTCEINSDSDINTDADASNTNLEYTEILSETQNDSNNVHNYNIDIHKFFNDLKDKIAQIEKTTDNDISSLKMFNDTLELYLKSELENTKIDLEHTKIDLDSTKSYLTNSIIDINNNISQLYEKINDIKKNDDYIFDE